MSYTNPNNRKYAVWTGDTFVRMFSRKTDACVYAMTREQITGDMHDVRRVSDADQAAITAQANERMGLGAWL